MLEALGFFALVEVVGLAAAPLAALVFGRLPGAGLGFAKPLGLLLVTGWCGCGVGRASARTPRRPCSSSSRCRARRRRWWPARQRMLRARRGAAGRGLAGRAGGASGSRARALPAEDPARLPAVDRLRGRVRRRVRRDGAARRLLARRVGDREADGHGVRQRRERVDSFPPHDPWMAGEDLNYYYLGHLAMAIVIRVVGVAGARRRATTSPFALLAALSRVGGVHARRHAVGGRAGRGCPACAAARSRSALAAVVRVHRARQPRRARASGSTPPTRRATTTGSRPRA